MKKTIRWIFATVVFVACGLLLFAKISNILRQKTGAQVDMIHSFYSEPKDTVDVLCLGSSHGYSGVQTNIMWNEFGITSYVLCSPRQSVASSYYLLKEALNYQKPKVVLLESYYLRSSKLYVEEVTMRQAFDGVRMSELKQEMLEDFIGDYSWKDKLSYYIPFIKYHSRWSILKNEDFNSRPYLKGSIVDFDVYPMENPGVPKKGKDMSETAKKYFELIEQLCNENGIQLVVFATPYGIANKYESYMNSQRTNVGLETYLAEKGIPFFFYQKMDEVGIDYATDFRDHGHMNTYGAAKVTKHLGNFLREEYGITDHRQDESYQSWNEDYAKYEEYANELKTAA